MRSDGLWIAGSDDRAESAAIRVVAGITPRGLQRSANDEARCRHGENLR